MNYSGWELKYFDLSHNFRKYQFDLIKGHLGKKILEVGPGSGKFAKKFLIQNADEVHLTEINKDLHKSLYDELKDVKEKVKIFSKKIEDLNDTYDTICYFDVLEHIEDHEKEIKNALQKLNKDGNLIIIVPAFNHLYSYYDQSIGHYRRYEKAFFQNYLKENNLKCKKLFYFDTIGYLFLLINKLINTRNKNRVSIGTIIWNLLVPISKILDKILFHKFGKSLICVIQNKN